MHIVTLSHLMLQAAHIATTRRQLNRATLAIHHLCNRRLSLQHGVGHMNLALGARAARRRKILLVATFTRANMEYIGKLALHLGDGIVAQYIHRNAAILGLAHALRALAIVALERH